MSSPLVRINAAVTKQSMKQTNSIPAISSGPFEATPIGLLVTEQNVSFEVWQAYGEGLKRVEGAIQWVIGDWLNFGEHAYGEKYSQALELWPETEYETLKKLAAVSNRVEKGNRLPLLSWTHHFQVAYLEPAEQRRWLADAQTKDWSVRDLRNQIKLAGGQTVPGGMGLLEENDGVQFWFWALPRPLTSGWGSGDIWQRISQEFGKPDAAFGVRDNVPADIMGVDLTTGYDWNKLPFADNHFAFGYWDPPYDHLYKNEGIEIWRTCKRIAILHTHIWPRSWLTGAKRQAMVAVTMGPMKQIRCLQVFEKATPNSSM